MNLLYNAIALILIFFFMIVLGITFYIKTPIQNGFYTVINSVMPNSTTDSAYLWMLSTDVLVIQLFYVLVSLLVFLTFMSSLVDSQSWQGWLISVIGGLIVTPLCIYIITSIWNGITVAGFSFSQISMVFVNSWTMIMTIHFFFGILSFVFIKRGSIK